MQQPNDFLRLMQLTQTEAGQRLFSLLQQSGGETLQMAAAEAQKGNYDRAGQLLSPLLRSSEAQTLLSQLGGSL